MQSFSEGQFKSRVNAALQRVRMILDNTRQPQYAADVRHEYQDKYLLAEFLAQATIGGQVTCLEALGLVDKSMQQLREWARTRNVTLRLQSEESCAFLRKVEREVESDTKVVSKSTVFGTRETYTVTKVTEYFWNFGARYELLAFAGAEPSAAASGGNRVVLQSRSAHVEVKTSVESTPKPATVVRPPIDVNITWLLQALEDDSAGASHVRARFAIDRQSAKTCHTPRRNAQVDAALLFFATLYQWASSVHNYFTGQLFPVQADHGLDLGAIKDTGLFVPALPLFDEKAGAGAASIRAYGAPFASEQQRSLTARFQELATAFPSNDKLITVAEAKLMVTALHVRQLCQAFGDGVDYIEDMLRKQLVAAIGKEVGPSDFAEYMRFHGRKLFRPEYQPRAFCYSIRRPGHYPEGLISVEAQLSGGETPAEPIHTAVCWQQAAPRPMRFALDAATEVSVRGERFLHGWVSHRFSGASGSDLSLTARARQFSSFMVLIGTVAATDLFLPKYAFIVQNKDDFRIPLELETIPTPKEFRDAIESLSPEQQRFAKAFRSMQLASTLFGVCVIQIKPAMERLLNLPDDSLTKEIALTQDLQRLFIEYQIPSDLLSYDGDPAVAVSTKVDTVRRYVANMQAMLNKTKQEELDEAKNKQQLRLAERDVLSPPSPSPSEPVPLPPPMLLSGPPRPMLRRLSGAMMSAISSPSSAPPPPSAASLAPPAAQAQASRVPSPRAAAAPVHVAAASAAPSPQPKTTAAVTTTTAAATTATTTKTPTTGSASAAPVQVHGKDASATVESVDGETRDITTIPNEMERKFDVLDTDGALRPTIIKAGTTWRRKFQKALLAAPEEKTLQADEQTTERQRAFDLLDALTKSGALPLDAASVHVIIAATHTFDKTLMNTVIQDNVNPVEKVERSVLIVTTTIQDRPAAELIAPDQLERVGTYSPQLIESAAAGSGLAAAALPAASTIKKL